MIGAIVGSAMAEAKQRQEYVKLCLEIGIKPIVFKSPKIEPPKESDNSIWWLCLLILAL